MALKSNCKSGKFQEQCAGLRSNIILSTPFLRSLSLGNPPGRVPEEESGKDFAFSFGFLKGLDLSIFRGLNFWEISRLDLTFPLLIPTAF
ncbi:hypothetical protein CDAR_30791 [Caerostris darwini]|uniref:Uncharacterized protein n=1 Tax=Caerostris darwini TaxID=1538125 RepID=A0AAV4SA21_9ARAC|nr:hypothetical protein CDAR_30791 [Caerostris darwini]